MRRALVLIPLLSLGTACSDDSPSALDPQGPEAERLAGLWWLLLVLSTLVFVVVMILLVGGLWRRRAPGGDDAAPPVADDDERADRLGPLDRRFVVGGGLVLPLVVLAGLGVVTVDSIVALGQQEGELEIEVEAKQFWWEVRYPEAGVVTANEVHIPAGRPVTVTLTSVDVIHSFWVPELAGKRDMVPGKTTSIVLEANEPGVYRGQCAEYCGVQHANMAVLVVAHPSDEFDGWLRDEGQDAREPAVAAERQGRDVFVSNACAGCHAIRGTEARGDLGPDLTHLASRRTLGAGTVELDRANLARWIVDAQSIKPGSLMPSLSLDAEELDALLVYLESLR